MFAESEYALLQRERQLRMAIAALEEISTLKSGCGEATRAWFIAAAALRDMRVPRKKREPVREP